MDKYKEYKTDKEAQELVDYYFEDLTDTSTERFFPDFSNIYKERFLETLEDFSNLRGTGDDGKSCGFAGNVFWIVEHDHELTEEESKFIEEENKKRRYIKEENRYLETGVIFNFYGPIDEADHFCTVITNEEFYERLCKACEIYIEKYPELEIQIKELLDKINESLKRNFFKWGEWRIK